MKCYKGTVEWNYDDEKTIDNILTCGNTLTEAVNKIDRFYANDFIRIINLSPIDEEVMVIGKEDFFSLDELLEDI